jgi:hypothetical protein
MARIEPRPKGRAQAWAAALGAIAIAAQAPAAAAACRVSDFLDRPLATLSELQRAAFVAQMTPTEYARIKSAAPGAPLHDAFVAGSTDLAQAQAGAQAKIDALKLENSAQYQKVWATDFLSQEALEKYLVCSSLQRPGLWLSGRSQGPGVFTAVLAHYLPVGVEKISLRVVAHDNIANIDDFKAFLKSLGEQDYFTVRSFPLKLADPGQRAVLIVRAGYETPTWLYIPVYPAPAVH